MGGNPAEHCFVLRNTVPMSFFKWLMIVWLKINVAGKMFGKICLTAIRDFFQYVICNQGRDRGNRFFFWRWYPTEVKSSFFWACRETPSPIPSCSGKSWSSHKENLEMVSGEKGNLLHLMFITELLLVLPAGHIDPHIIDRVTKPSQVPWTYQLESDTLTYGAIRNMYVTEELRKTFEELANKGGVFWNNVDVASMLFSQRLNWSGLVFFFKNLPVLIWNI